MPETFTIFCMTGPRHVGRRKPVAEFRRVSEFFGRWTEITHRPDIGQAILDDGPAPVGWANDPSMSGGDFRERYVLACPRCGKREAVQVRADRLFDMLDKMHESGLTTCSLSALRTILS